MTIGAISVQEDTPFKEIVDLLDAHEINAVPVVDARPRCSPRSWTPPWCASAPACPGPVS
ncbi:hypothetical protein [Dactylosporangium sp. NPDC005555]|uniref:hypothetical protein n=1 Tax=Dactylosporangium sp. NPDC005555 TaxID=3154889 RepID=UPI0033A45092